METILLVDDEPANILMLQSILQKNGYHSQSCESGLQALQMLRNNDIDLVLLDVMLVGIDGYETCKRIRAYNHDIPVILVTALTGSNDLKRGFEAGAVDYIKKPIDATELISRIKSALKIANAEKHFKNAYLEVMRDLDIASQIQSYMLPEQFVIADNLIFCSKYTPCGKIGGDLFDIIKISQSKYFIYIADISGHGIQAALLMAAVKSIIKMIVGQSEGNSSPCHIINKVNTVMSEDMFKDNYVTILAGYIDLHEQTFRYFNAGHPPIIEYDIQTGKTRTCSSTGSIPVGWAADMTYAPENESCLKLDANTIFFLYTDGIIECENATAGQLGIAGLAGLLENITTVENCLLLPHKLEQQLLDADYMVSADDFSMLTFQKIAKLEKRWYFDLSEMAGLKTCELGAAGSMLASVGTAGLLCNEKITEWTNDPDLAARTEIVLTEFLNNILIHSLRKKRGSVVVELSAKDVVRMRFFDSGINWQPDMACGPSENLFDNQDRYADCGLGMKMIRTLASSFTRRRFGQVNETVIEMDRAMAHAR